MKNDKLSRDHKYRSTRLRQDFDKRVIYIDFNGYKATLMKIRAGMKVYSVTGIKRNVLSRCE